MILLILDDLNIIINLPIIIIDLPPHVLRKEASAHFSLSNTLSHFPKFSAYTSLLQLSGETLTQQIHSHRQRCKIIRNIIASQ